MMLLLSKLMMTGLETLAYFIIYQLFSIRKRNSKLMLGVFFAFVYFLNLILDKTLMVHNLLFYAIFILLFNTALKYDVKTSCFFGLQTFLTLMSSVLFTSINIVLWTGKSIDAIDFWNKGSFSQYLIFFSFLIGFSLLMHLLYKNLKKRVGLSRNIAVPVRLAMVVSFILLILVSTWLFSFLTINLEAIRAIKELPTLLLLGYYLLTTSVVHGCYVSIHNLCFKQKLNRVSHLAENDSLTGLLSRSAGMNFLRKAFNQAKVTGHRLTIAFIDVNDLKVVNDKFGHHAGDRLIEKISEVIKSCIRETDGAMRFGGDEFVVILPDCPQYRAEEIMTQVNVYLNRLNLSGELKYKVSVSHGLVEYNALRHSNALDLLAEADTEMYKNKKKNKSPNR